MRWQWSFKLRLLLQKALDWATKTSSLDDDNDNLPKIDASAEKTPIEKNFELEKCLLLIDWLIDLLIDLIDTCYIFIHFQLIKSAWLFGWWGGDDDQ